MRTILILLAALICLGSSADAQTNLATNLASSTASNTARLRSCKPTVTSVTAATGTEAGGTTVTVAGTCFTGATSVTFGGVAGTSLGSVTPTSLSIVTPATTSGSGVVFDGRATTALSSTAADNNVTVAVTTPYGTGTLAAGFQYTSEFARIFGGLLSKEHRASDPRIGLNASAVSSWPDYAGNGAATQATGSKQPAFAATGWNGGPCVTFDGTDDYLSATLSTTVPNGNRPYALLVGRRVAGTSLNAFATFLNSGLANYFVVRGYNSGSSGYSINSGSQSQNFVTFAASDTAKHLFEVGFRTSGTNAGVYDGTGFNSTVTSAISGGAMDQLIIGAWSTSAQFANADIVAVIVLNNEPTAQNLTDARAAFKSTTTIWRGYTSGLGLP